MDLTILEDGGFLHVLIGWQEPHYIVAVVIEFFPGHLVNTLPSTNLNTSMWPPLITILLIRNGIHVIVFEWLSQRNKRQHPWWPL